jgi:hypothetical protein
MKDKNINTEDEFSKQLEDIRNITAKIDSNTPDVAPEYKKPDNFFTLSKDIIELKDSTKVANFDKTDIGKLKLSARGCKAIALISKGYDLPLVEEYFKDYAEIVASTSMGKDGFWARLLVTNITKKVSKSINPEQKKSWFGLGKEKENPMNAGMMESE